jgi:hypothetical protein
MADTNPNIPIPAGQWVNLYALAGADIGSQLTVENTGTCDIYLAVQAFQPEPDHKSYNILRRTDPRLTNSVGDLGAWAFCPNTDGEINVSIDGADSFIPVIATAGTPLSEIQQTDRINEQEFMRSLLTILGSVDHELHLLNARFEEAFDTGLDGSDTE